MAGGIGGLRGPTTHKRTIQHDPTWLRISLTALAWGFIVVMVGIPLYTVMTTAFRDGLGAWAHALGEAETLHAVGLTALAAGIAVTANTFFGVAASWAITKFDFPGKRVLLTLIDLPFAVSPVVAGMIFVLLFGGGTMLGRSLVEWGMPIVFAIPGIVIATTFVTFPFIARELIPTMSQQGVDQELAAITLGASPWQVFSLVTLPNIRWALLYGMILCSSRAIGEFGAVSVVSGHIRGETNTVPLHIEILYNEYQFVAAFSVSTLLVGVAFATILARFSLEARVARSLAKRKGD
jgi:sulfate transport system permease protein